MIRKIGVLGISLLCFTAITSCEKDFSEVGTNVVTNDKFETGEILLDVEITPIDLQNVQADNINASISDYWLGVYNNPNAKKIEASIVSQLGYISGLKTQENVVDGDTIFSLDKVILKLPYQATAKTSGGVTSYKLDSILGDPDTAVDIQVLQNETFLNTLDPLDPTKKNSFFSDAEYLGNTVLNENSTPYSFKPKASDTIFKFNRIDRSVSLANTTTYEDILRVYNAQGAKIPFLAIPLDLTTMKSIFWDEFENTSFSSKDDFDEYFKGIKIIASGNNGAMAPFNLATTPTPSVDFYYTKSVLEAGNVKDTIQSKYTFPLSGIRNSIYKMSPIAMQPPANKFVIQGTAGSSAEIKILDNAKVQELRANNWLINDVSLTFYVDQTINTEANIIPQQLFLYQNKDNGTGGITPTHISDSYNEPAYFGGNLTLTEDENPEKYIFRITDYISNLLAGEDNFTTDPLVLKVYNPTDFPTTNSTGGVNTNVKTYNWNPRAVTLLDGSETANGTKRAVLKISYSKEK